MATASFGKVVKLNDDMAQRIVEAAAKPPKKVKVKKGAVSTKIDPSLIHIPGCI